MQSKWNDVEQHDEIIDDDEVPPAMQMCIALAQAMKQINQVTNLIEADEKMPLKANLNELKAYDSTFTSVNH